MKQLLLLLTTLFLLCISCNKESIDIETEDESGLVEVSVFYTTKENPNILMPDSYSKLYIYYDQHFTGFTCYSFQDGKLTKEGKTIFPDQSASADKEGKILLRLNYINKPLTLFVESNHCKRISIGSHSTGEKKIISTITFGP